MNFRDGEGHPVIYKMTVITDKYFFCTLATLNACQKWYLTLLKFSLKLIYIVKNKIQQ
jgi:hypothetical protein